MKKQMDGVTYLVKPRINGCSGCVFSERAGCAKSYDAMGYCGSDCLDDEEREKQLLPNGAVFVEDTDEGRAKYIAARMGV